MRVSSGGQADNQAEAQRRGDREVQLIPGRGKGITELICHRGGIAWYRPSWDSLFTSPNSFFLGPARWGIL